MYLQDAKRARADDAVEEVIPEIPSRASKRPRVATRSQTAKFPDAAQDKEKVGEILSLSDLFSLVIHCSALLDSYHCWHPHQPAPCFFVLAVFHESSSLHLLFCTTLHSRKFTNLCSLLLASSPGHVRFCKSYPWLRIPFRKNHSHMLFLYANLHADTLDLDCLLPEPLQSTILS